MVVRKLRKWRKKVSYDCRKKVADSRLRIKGKFVTRVQVCEQLGTVDMDIYTGDEIKELLEKKKEGHREKSSQNE